MIFAPLCLILCWMLPVYSMTIRFNFKIRHPELSIPLSMADDSVDDMYFGCDDAMMERVKKDYLEEEKYEKPFAKAWDEAGECAERKLEHRENKALTIDHLQAICAYTDDNIYTMFNDVVRTGRSIYGSSFKFHSLHFLLTSAIQILKTDYYCHTTYRRTRVRFTGEVSDRIRFGSFASSSFRTDLTDFGHETCFKIETCLGAPLKKYSVFPDEEEVLIPPYEVFNITEKISGQVKIDGLTDCKVIFVLKNLGSRSTLNCKAVF
ncbi:erythroblast NAD(P)(+)--arginine ADP-ribosyltransferase-like [Sparus aurata]|uniref:erythroblast NAD(P)(+)--arginine ADP-ribosyltransferase-like n=1 Tax=Sparus aurata TaxID=8175 RepID=UPI0011C1BA7E|nr:erythroblast NAD(P)(+)--arginine ADP-ribosyltransferase-like [Sparus aurata]